MITPRNVIAAAVLLAIAVLLFSVKGCLDARQRASQAQHEAKTADAYAGAAKEAVATVSARSEAEADLKQVVTEAAKDIANAEGSDQPIPPAARAAALRAACRLPDYRGDPRCKVQPANP